jgi:hypothetical protein
MIEYNLGTNSSKTWVLTHLSHVHNECMKKEKKMYEDIRELNGVSNFVPICI